MADYTEHDYRVALYFEHYDAGGAFDHLTPSEYQELERQVEQTWEYLKVHGLPAGMDISP